MRNKIPRKAGIHRVMLSQGRGFFPMDTPLTFRELRKIATDENRSWAERTAAWHMAESIPADPKDFQYIVDGDETLEEAARRGVRTDAIKKLRKRTWTKDDGTVITETELELHDRSGPSIDRVLDRAYGKAAVTVQGGDKPIAVAAMQIQIPAGCLNLEPKQLREIINGVTENAMAAEQQKERALVERKLLEGDSNGNGNGHADK